MKLKSSETVLKGKWERDKQGKVVANYECERISWLLKNALVELAASETEWDTLLRNPEDDSLWELTYPCSGMHGGGPPLLTKITAVIAADKYRFG